MSKLNEKPKKTPKDLNGVKMMPLRDSNIYLMNILLKVQNSGIDFANDPKSPASVALAEALQAIEAYIAERETQARIDELNDFEFNWSPLLVAGPKQYLKRRLDHLSKGDSNEN